jgi:hypothetical protein
MPTLVDRFDQIKQAYSDIFVIVAPPRSGSTALSRVLWEQPSVRYYAHEPFEVTYYQGREVGEALEKLCDPLDLSGVKLNPGDGRGRGLVVKEMPYQVGDSFPKLVSLTDKPVIFLIRDPRSQICSRMRKKIEVGDSPLFPLIESGWELLDGQITHCRQEGIPFVIIDSGDFRRYPEPVFEVFFSALGLPFSAGYLRWRALPGFDLDNLEGDHTHLYTSVLESEGVTADTDPRPTLEDFPEEGGFRAHVVECQGIYQRLREMEELIRAPAG